MALDGNTLFEEIFCNSSWLFLSCEQGLITTFDCENATLHNLIFTGVSVEGALVWNWGKSESEIFLYVDIVLIVQLSVWGHTVCVLNLCVWVTVCEMGGNLRAVSFKVCKSRREKPYNPPILMVSLSYETSIIINLSELSNDQSIQ